MRSRNNHIALKPKSKGVKFQKVTTGLPETVIVRLARKGKLAEAGRKAIESSLQKGIAVIILENGKIFRIYPDGKREFIKSILPSRHRYLTGKARIA